MPMSNLLAIVATLSLFLACKSPQPARPEEFYDKLSVEPEPSVISIPIRIYRNELQENINKQLGEVLYEDKNLADDGLMLKASKQGNITLEILENQIKYNVPLKLWIKKDLGITDVEAEGALALTFTTIYNIKPDWSLETATELTGYKWSKEPVVKLGFASMPVTSIANIFINNSRKEIAASIDEQVKDFFDLKKEMETAWKELHEPFEVSDEYLAWLLLRPQSLGMSPLKSDNNYFESTVVVTCKPLVVLGEKPVVAGQTSTLPPFAYIEAGGKDFTLYLNTEIPFPEAKRIVRQNMVGETYSTGNKTVKIEDIDLYGQGNRLVVNTKLSGSYNGNVYFVGKPKYNAKSNNIELEDVDFDFDSKRALLKTASWLFKGTLKKQVQESLDFYLRYNIDDTKKFIQEQLQNYQLSPGIILNGNLDELNVSHVYIATNAIKVRIGLKGKLNLDVKGLGL